MYKHSKEIPWHQDKTANQVFVDIDLAIIKHFLPRESSYSICDLGCGLGYVTNRIYKEFQEFMPELVVTGIDISKSAAAQAGVMHKDINFYGIDIMNDDISKFYSKYDLIYIKDVIWYVAQDIEKFIQKVALLLNDTGLIYVLQSVPDKVHFIGSDIFPSAISIAEFLKEKFNVVYVSTTYEVNSTRVKGEAKKDRYLRFLGSKII